MRSMLHSVVRTLLLLTALTWAEHEDTRSTGPPVSTCPSRTVNYITHHLPQQCLATDRAFKLNSSDGSLLDNPVRVLDPIPTRPNITYQATSVNDSLHDATESPRSNTGTTASIEQSIQTTRSADTQIVLAEEDSALEGGSFLSFEDWKREKLKKAGQSEQIGQRQPAGNKEKRHRPERALESLGDDGEIDIDFSGFVPGGPVKGIPGSAQSLNDPATVDSQAAAPKSASARTRSKDAGTTCKERFNYASFDCAAIVLKTNKEAKSPNTILVENKDSYMLNQCSASEKFIILELCNDILIDTVVLANFEFFSSTFRTFRVSVSDRYPVKVDKWQQLGIYEARNSREVQAFLVENPIIWARYLRIDFLSHYGNEFYCPVSLVRVHGTTMSEDYKHDQELAMGEEEEVDSVDENESPMFPVSQVDSLTPEAVAAEILTGSPSVMPEILETPPNEPPAPQNDNHTAEQYIEVLHGQDEALPPSVVAMEAIMSVIEPTDTCIPAESPSYTDSEQQAALQTNSASSKLPSPARSASTPQTTLPANSSQSAHGPGDMMTTTSPTQEPGKNVTGSLTSLVESKDTTPETKAFSPSTSTVSSKIPEISTASDAAKAKNRPASSTSSEKTKSSQTVHASPAIPTTPDSFFKSFQKRLQLLEANSSMSLQYIEEQSKALREAFKKVEQRQIARTNTFLEQLNMTVLNELREFRQQYDQLWQSTVIELETQRERYERDNRAINARIGVLADEVIFQRRMAILQMVLILVCLALVLFSRGAINNYLELPIVQNVLAKSPSSRWLNLSTDSLIRPAKPVRTRSAHQLRTERTGILKGHGRMQSEDSITDNPGASEIFAPPTPLSEYGQSEVELGRDFERYESKTPITDSEKEETFNDPEFDPSTIERPATSPPVLHVNDEPAISEILAADHNANGLAMNEKSLSVPNGDSHQLQPSEEPSPIVKRLSFKLPP